MPGPRSLIQTTGTKVFRELLDSRDTLVFPQQSICVYSQEVGRTDLPPISCLFRPSFAVSFDSKSKEKTYFFWELLDLGIMDHSWASQVAQWVKDTPVM